MSEKFFRKNSERYGFTLVELLIAIAMFSLFSLTLTQLLMGGLDSFKRGQVLSTLRGELSTAMSLIEADLRSATGSRAFTSPVYTSNAQVLKASFSRFVRRDNDWDVVGTVNSYKVEYSIDKEGDSYVLNYTDKDQQKYKILDNVMLSSVPGQAGTSGSYNSYFQWDRVSYGDNVNKVPDDVLQIRLMSGRYLGKEIMTMSMATSVSVRTPTSASDMKASGGLRTQDTEIPPFELQLRAGNLSF